MTIAWHDEARRLRAGGMTVSDIARELGETRGAVRYFFYILEEGSREKELERNRTREKRRVRSPSGGYERSFVKSHKPRIIKKLPGDPREIARRFAANEIDRSELSRQLWSA